MKKRIIFLIGFLLMMSTIGCLGPQQKPDGKSAQPAPEIKETKNFNTPEKKEKLVVLPSEWNSYRQSLDQLVGTYIALVPDKESPTGYSVKILDRAITKEGMQKIERKTVEGAEPIYKSRVDGNFAGNLSFVIGSVTTKTESLYDFTLADNAIALIPPDSAYADKTKVQLVLKKLPSTYKDLFFVTSVTHRMLAYKEYQKYTGSVEGAYTVVKAGADFYYGNEITSVTHAIYFSGLSDAAIFGIQNEMTGLYTKIDLGSEGIKHDDKKRTVISEESINLLNMAIKLNGVQVVK